MGRRTPIKQVSRREFVKGAAGVAGVAAVGALASCVPITPAAPAAPTPEPQKWDEEVDVVVVGAGIGGMVAAVEASTQGAQVTVLEKMDVTGGTSMQHGGQFIAYGPTSFQKDQKVEAIRLKEEDISNFRRLAPKLWVEWAKKHPLAMKAFKSQFEYMKSVKIGHISEKDMVDPGGKKLVF